MCAFRRSGSRKGKYLLSTPVKKKSGVPEKEISMASTVAKDVSQRDRVVRKSDSKKKLLRNSRSELSKKFQKSTLDNDRSKALKKRARSKSQSPEIQRNRDEDIGVPLRKKQKISKYDRHGNEETNLKKNSATSLTLRRTDENTHEVRSVPDACRESGVSHYSLYESDDSEEEPAAATTVDCETADFNPHNSSLYHRLTNRLSITDALNDESESEEESGRQFEKKTAENSVPQDGESITGSEESNAERRLGGSIVLSPMEKSARNTELEYQPTVEEIVQYDEGEENWEADEDFDGEHDPLLLSMRLQKQRMSKQVPIPRSSAAAVILFSPVRNVPAASQRTSGENLKEEWEMEYQRRNTLFFESEEAKLRVPQTVKTTASGVVRASSYHGVKVNETNNSDIRFCYRNEFGGRNSRTKDRTESYYNFCLCLGQIARAGIALEKLSKKSLWRPGAFFRIADNIKFFELFVNHFSTSSTPTTLMNKHAQLLKFVNCAISYWDQNPKYSGDDLQSQKANSKMRAKMVVVASLLRNGKAKNKSASRRARQYSKEDTHRTEVGKNVTEGTLKILQESAISELESIHQFILNIFRERKCVDMAKKREVFSSNMMGNWDLMLKWCLNFLALLIVYGNGQRNQVYTFLKCPDVSYLESFTTALSEGQVHEPLKVYIHAREKRARDSRLPFIMLDPETAPFVSFHVQFAQPLLLDRYNRERGTVDAQKLLLDTRNGCPLSSSNIRHSFKRWVRNIDAELSITPMDIRSGYATMMIRRHARRNENADDNQFAFKEMSEDDFVTLLACVMNTGVEQLREVYASASHEDYATHVARIMRICGTGRDEA